MKMNIPKVFLLYHLCLPFGQYPNLRAERRHPLSSTLTMHSHEPCLDQRPRTIHCLPAVVRPRHPSRRSSHLGPNPPLSFVAPLLRLGCRSNVGLVMFSRTFVSRPDSMLVRTRKNFFMDLKLFARDF